MSELNKLGTQFDKVAKEARNLDQRLNGLYEDMGNILSRYYKIGEISEDEMKQRLYRIELFFYQTILIYFWYYQIRR